MNETAGHKQVCLEFDDNERLRLICGQHNRHLARIEQALGVGMNSFGNQITISGEGDNVDRASQTFTSLYRQLSDCLLYTSPSPRDISGSRMPSSA